MTKPNFIIEKKFYNSKYVTKVIGVDEVGRGALAGPVVACAVLLPINDNIEKDMESLGVNDSKKLSILKRNKISGIITTQHPYAIGMSSVEEIDQHNIFNATMLAMLRAIEQIINNPLLEIEINSKILGAQNQSVLEESEHEKQNILDVESLGTSNDKIISDIVILIDGTHNPISIAQKKHISHIPNVNFEHITTIKGGDGKSLSIASASIIAKVARDNIMIELHNIFPKYQWNNNKGYGTMVHIEAIKQYGATICHRKSFIKNINI